MAVFDSIQKVLFCALYSSTNLVLNEDSIAAEQSLLKDLMFFLQDKNVFGVFIYS